MGYIDNNQTTKGKIRQQAKLNVEAYRSVYRDEVNREKSTDMLFKIMGYLLWYGFIYPILFILHFLCQCLLAWITGNEIKNTNL